MNGFHSFYYQLRRNLSGVARTGTRRVQKFRGKNRDNVASTHPSSKEEFYRVMYIVDFTALT